MEPFTYQPLSGHALKLLRRAMGLTLADVARVSKTPVSTVQRREGADAVTLDYALKVLAAFAVMDMEHPRDGRTTTISEEETTLSKKTEQSKPSDGAPTIAVGPQAGKPSYTGKPRPLARPIDEGGVQDAPGRLSGR